MAGLLTGDDSAITLVDSPNEAFSPRAVKDELIPLILPEPQQPSSVKHSIISNSIKEETSLNHCGILEQQPIKFVHAIEPRVLRENTLVEALAAQMGDNISAHAVSETVIQTICESLANDPDDAYRLINDLKTTIKITQIIDKYAATIVKRANQRQREIDSFTKTQSKSKYTPSRSEMTTLHFYLEILPADLIKEVKKKTTNKGKICCMGLTRKKARCGKPNKFNESRLNALVEQLSGISKRPDFLRVFEMLSETVDMLFCWWHLESKMLTISQLKGYLTKNMNSSIRRHGLECFDRWLKILGQVDDLSDEDGRAKEVHVVSTNDIELVEPLSPLSGDVDTSSMVPVFQIKKEAVAEVVTNYHSLSGNEHVSATFDCVNERSSYLPSLTHKTLQPYSWPAKQDTFEPEQLVNQIISEQLAPTDRTSQGQIYVYRHHLDFGLVKIGHTIDVEARLSDWTKQCGYEIDECKDLLQNIYRLAPHTKRLEQLIHAELKRKRFEVVKCEHCGKKHVEWFQVSSIEAQKIVKKWTLWMQRGPYCKDGYLRFPAEDRPVVGDCEETLTTVGPKISDRRSRPARRPRPVAPSIHHMITRSNAQSQPHIHWETIVPAVTPKVVTP